MNIQLILPKEMVWIPKTSIHPLYFLAGPVLGGDDWQKDAIEMIARKHPGSQIVCPCRWEADHPLYQYRQIGILPEKYNDEHTHITSSQTLWERYYMRHASLRGCLLFWLPKESTTKPRPIDTGPYGRDSYGEQGEWRYRLSQNPSLGVVLGGDSDFSGLRVIAKNWRDLNGSDFPIYQTLEETVDAAVAKATR